jgi:hypothetical protein
MDERREFKVGETVYLSDLGASRGLQGRAKSRKGVVAGLSRSPLGVIVQRDGLRGKDHYHRDFWQWEKPE